MPLQAAGPGMIPVFVGTTVGDKSDGASSYRCDNHVSKLDNNKLYCPTWGSRCMVPYLVANIFA